MIRMTIFFVKLSWCHGDLGRRASNRPDNPSDEGPGPDCDIEGDGEEEQVKHGTDGENEVESSENAVYIHNPSSKTSRDRVKRGIRKDSKTANDKSEK